MNDQPAPVTTTALARRPSLRLANRALLGKLAVVSALMFGFGYALVPMYRAICEALGINVLALQEQGGAAASRAKAESAPVNSQVDSSRTITVEFDANARGPWRFVPRQASMQVHPGELATIVYDIWNPNPQAMLAQSIPSYAPGQAAAHFTKLECFCFKEQKLGPGERRSFPVVFVIDPKLPRDVNTITLSYTFFEVGARPPQAPSRGKLDA
jgi:cytochrome c oxidase assembly protein subunit 11